MTTGVGPAPSPTALSVRRRPASKRRHRFRPTLGRTGRLRTLVVAATSLDHPHRAVCLTNLAKKLSYKVMQIGNLGDLQQAISHLKEAVAVTPLYHLDRASSLNIFVNNLISRFQLIGDLDDLQQTILYAEEVVAATPIDHIDRALRLNNLATNLNSRFERTR